MEQDPLWIGTTRDVFQEQVVIDRLKSLTSTGATLHATPLSILAEIPSKPFDLVASSESNRSKISSSEVESGGSAELKQLCKKVLEYWLH